MGKTMTSVADNLRAARRLGYAMAYIPLAGAMMAAQIAVMGPVFGNRTLMPRLIFRGFRRLAGLKVAFNTSAAPLVTGRPAWYVANHASLADPFVIAGNVDGMFAGKGNFLKWPFFAAFLRSVRYVGLRRTNNYNEQSRGKLIRNFNDGINMIMFPEATTTDGKQVHMFHAGLMGLLFGDPAVDKAGSPVRLNKDVVVQPLAIRVKAVNGKDARGDKGALLQCYTMHGEHNPLRQAWKRMKVKSIILEINPLPPLSPADYADSRALANQAARSVASVINPGQTEFTKAKMPRLDRKYW